MMSDSDSDIVYDPNIINYYKFFMMSDSDSDSDRVYDPNINYQAFWEKEMDKDKDFFIKWLTAFTITIFDQPEGRDIDITRHPEIVKYLFNCRGRLFEKPLHSSLRHNGGIPTTHSLLFLCRDDIDKLKTNKISIKANRETDNIITRALYLRFYYLTLQHRIAKFREELIRVTWHPDRFWDWCLDNSDKDT